MPQRGFLALAAAAVCLSWQPLPAPAQPASKILIVTTLGIPPYQQAVKGVMERLIAGGIRPTVLELSAEGSEVLIAAAMQNGPYKAVVAVGPEARWSLGRASVKAPVLSTMIFLSDLDEEAAQSRALPQNLAATVYLDPNPEDAVKQLRDALPSMARVGLIVPSLKNATPWATAFIKRKFQVQVVECPRGADLVKTFLGLRNKVDFVLAMPIPKLYNTSTIEPLLRASLDHHLPVIGFSESFVQAGAMAGVYAPYEDLGMQTADIALKMANGAKMLEDETPHKLTVKTNQKVLRVMGRNF
jgi:ABC-type uncharacterized transport system substrate-binding protein